MTKTRLALTVVSLLGLAIQVVRPTRTNPPSDPADTISAHLPIPADMGNILERACRDCHSNDTRWPWYSHVAPVSWWVIEHVNHGRTHFNYSRWGTYTRDQQSSLLEQSCSLSSTHDMPLGSYRLMHSSARLTPGDIDVLCRWTRQAAAARRSD
jgi:hypothetical protein